VDLAQRLVEAGCPVGALDPRVEPAVHERDGFVVTLWTHYESGSSSRIAPADYADALSRLHAGMRTIDVATLGDFRAVGRARLPSTVIGCLVHGAEHAMRHVGQISVTARIVRGA